MQSSHSGTMGLFRFFAFYRFSVSGNEMCSFCWDTLPQLVHLKFLGIYCNQVEIEHFVQVTSCSSHISPLPIQLGDFQEVLRFLSHTPALTELFIGCNPFTAFQPISLELQHLLNFSHLQPSTLRSQITDIQQQQQQQQTVTLSTSQ